MSAVVSALALLALIGSAGPAAAQGMALPGKFAVSPTGAATYSIPIAVPPGTSGMIPSLSLSYNSQGGNGLLGMGWSLDGLPSIGRCPQTIAQDGVRGTVNFDANDRFCLDGQRLMAISGTYGANGTEYRTEIESFSKVISYGTAGTGPAWFEVRTKSGQVLQFGNTADSRVLAQGKTTARDWMVNKVSDTKGNYFTITYVNDTTNGQVYPSRIDYTANDAAGLAAYNSVRFVYDTVRPDISSIYHAGSLLRTTVRLTNLQTFAGSAMVADYRLTYATGPATGRSQLASVTLCDGANICLPATTFGWQNGSTVPSITANAGGLDGTLVDYRPYIGDFNGDGMADVFWNHVGTNSRVLWTSIGNGAFSVKTNVAGQNGTAPGHLPMVADFNRDGKTDIWWERTQYNMVQWTSTGDGGFAISIGPFRPSPAEKWTLAMLGDGNGDGRSDIAWLFHSSSSNFEFWLTNTDGTTTTLVRTPAGQFGIRWIQGVNGPDFTGDGVTDLLFTDPSGKGMQALSLGKGDGSFQQVAGADSSVSSYVAYFLDINGDGKADILWDNVDANGRSQGQRTLWLSKGNGTFVVQPNAGGQDGTLSGYRSYFGDFNGDGKTDILWDQGDTSGLSTGARVLWVGNGDGTFAIVPNYAGQNGALVGYVPILADFNGDGKTDILWDKRNSNTTLSTGQRVFWLSDGKAADLMTSVAAGTGASIAIIYKPLTDSAVYTRGTGATDPDVDLQGPIHVVSRADAGNGIGGILSTTYAYAGARANLNGRGFLGFREVKTTDLQTNIVHITTYHQGHPFVALVANETKTLGVQTLSQTKNSYSWSLLGAGRFQLSLLQSQATSSDVDGSAMPTVTSSYQYDAHGNATKIDVSATDGHAKVTTNTYSNDPTQWLLGRLTAATVTSLITQPGAPPPPPWSAGIPIEITSSTNNLNLWNYLLAKGLAVAGTPGTWRFIIASGVVIGSNSATIPALDTGAFPVGSSLQIINNGTIIGAGGKGGAGAVLGEYESVPAAPGASGGLAFRTQVPVTTANHGRIWGGGGGGGGGAGVRGGGGGGGAGFAFGSGGRAGVLFCDEWGTISSDGGAGTMSLGGAGGPAPFGCSTMCNAGGRGGDPGQAGRYGTGASEWTCDVPAGAGGPGGAAVLGNSFVTWVVVGDRRGPLN